MSPMPDWLFPAATMVFTLAAPFLSWWGASRYFSGQFDQWKRTTERRLDDLEKASLAGAETRQSNAVRLEGMSGQLDYLLSTVGKDGKSGLRGDLHGLRNDWTPILTRLQTLMERRE